MARLREMEGQTPGYTSRYDQDIADAYDRIMGRGSFQYDLNADALYRQIIDALEQRDYAASIAVSTEAILPQVTRVELMNSFALVSSYTTQTTGDANRNNNIHLACQAISRIVVMPGETFSFNEATGQRTTDKGYLPAPAIAGGATVDEVGGGVCQVSSTLFNAAAMADLTILSRSPHTWPSNYVEKGRDAYGDLHPRLGYPHSANDTAELLDYLRVLKQEGFFRPDDPLVLSMEVSPRPGEDEDIVVANTKRVLNRAWAMLED